MSSLRSSRAYSNLQVESIRWQQSALPPGSTNSFLVLDSGGQVGFSSITNLPVNLNVGSLTATQGISAGNLFVSGGITTQNLTATNSTLTNVHVTGTFLVSGVTLIPSGISVIDAQYIFAGTPGLTLGREFKGYRLDVSGAALFNGGVTLGGPVAATNAVIVRGADAQILLENATGVTMGSFQGRSTGAYIESDNQIVFSSLDESAGDVVIINPKGSMVTVKSGVTLTAGGVIDAQTSITNTTGKLLLDTDTAIAGNLTLSENIQTTLVTSTLSIQPSGGAVRLATSGNQTTIWGPLVAKEAATFNGNVSIVNNGALSVVGGLTTTTGYFNSGVTVSGLITGQAGLTTTTGYFSSGVTMDSLRVNNAASVGALTATSGNFGSGLVQTTGSGSFGSLSVANNATVTNAASVGGLLTATGSGIGLTVTNAAFVGGLLTVNGSGTGLNVTNNASVGGILTVNGSGTGLNVTNNASVGGTLTVNGTGTGLTVANAASVGGLLTAIGGITASSGYFGSSGVTVQGAIDARGGIINSAGALALNDDVNVSGTLTAGTLTVTSQLNVGTTMTPANLTITDGGSFSIFRRDGPLNCGVYNLLLRIPLAFGIENAAGSGHLYYPHLTWTGSTTRALPNGGAGFWSSSVIAVSVAPYTTIVLYDSLYNPYSYTNNSSEPAVANISTPPFNGNPSPITWTAYSAYFSS